MIPTDMARDPTRSTTPRQRRREDRWTVLYDPDCGFCRWSLAQLLALDRAHKLRPLALGSAEADRLLADLEPAERSASWHLVAPDGLRASGGIAAVPLLRLLPGGRAPAAILARAPRLTERSYRWVAEHRSIFSRLIPGAAKRRADQRVAQRSSQ